MPRRQRCSTTHDRVGRLVEVTPEFSRVFGVSGDDVIGSYPPFPWFPDEDRDKLTSMMAASLGDWGERFAGIKFVLSFHTPDHGPTPFFCHLEKHPDGLTEYVVQQSLEQDPDGLIEKAIALGNLARSLCVQAPSEIQSRLPLLSQRERRVLELLARGSRADRIARELHISVHTARNHRRAIFAKLEVGSQVELMAYLAGVEEL